MELRLCVIVEFFGSPVRNIFPRISLHDLPCHGTMRKGLLQVSLNKAAFLSVKQRSWIQTYSSNCLQYLCLSDILFECNPNKHGQGMMSVLPNQRLSWVLSTLGQCSVSFQPVLYRPHTQTRIVFFSVFKKAFPIWNFSQPCSNRISPNCLFPT